MFKSIEDIDFHLSIANRQRAKYNFDKKNLNDDEIMIDVDWKQKIIIGNFNFFVILLNPFKYALFESVSWTFVIHVFILQV